MSILTSEQLKIVSARTHLLTPGPVSCHPEVLKSLSLPMVHHLSSEFKATLEKVLGQVKKIFQTEQNVFLHTSTGSGAMESALVNTLSPGDKVLAIVSGKFGERWAEMAARYGLNVDRLNVTWGEAVDPNLVRQKLKSGDFSAVLTQACESSTAVLHPIKELGEITKSLDTLLMVDGISSVGAFPLPVDQWHIDVLVTGSQKALMLPAGLAMIALSQKAWTKHKTAKLPRYYWDLSMELENNKKGRNHFSSSVSLVRALNVALNILLTKGLDKHYESIAQQAQATKTAFEILNLKLFSKAPSPSLTAVQMPDGVSSDQIMKELEKKHKIFLAGGQDHLAGKILRIGHMGYIENIDLLFALEKIFETLPVKGDSARALKAAQEILC